MKGIADQLEEEIHKFQLHDMKWPVISNVNGLPYLESSVIAENLIRQLYSPVLWSSTVNYLASRDVHCFVEIGPKKILKSLVRQILPDPEVYSFETDLDKIYKLSNKYSESDSYEKVIQKCLTLAVTTRNNNPQDHEYNGGVILPIKNIKELIADYNENALPPSLVETGKAITMLKQVFQTKKINENEQREYFYEILTDSGNDRRIEEILAIPA
jgi:[acyl-carrier-protein] S-malonyltransferase